MVGWHHRLSAYEFELTLGDSERLGNLACWNSRDCKELDMTELNFKQQLCVTLTANILVTCISSSAVDYKEKNQARNLFNRVGLNFIQNTLLA